MVGHCRSWVYYAEMKPKSRCMAGSHDLGLRAVLVGVYRFSCGFSMVIAATTSTTPASSSDASTTSPVSWDSSSGRGGFIALGICAAFTIMCFGLSFYVWRIKDRKQNKRKAIQERLVQKQECSSSQRAASPKMQQYVKGTLVDKKFPMAFLLTPPGSISEAQAVKVRLAATELLQRFPDYKSEPKIVICFDDGCRSSDEASCGPGTFFAASITKHLWENDFPCVSKLMMQCEQQDESQWFCQNGDTTQPTYKSWFKTCSVVIVVETVSFYLSVECLQEMFMAIECNAVVIVLRFEACLPDFDCQWPTVLIDSEERKIKDVVQKCLFGIKPIPTPPAIIPTSSFFLNSVRQALEIHGVREPIDWGNYKMPPQAAIKAATFTAALAQRFTRIPFAIDIRPRKWQPSSRQVAAPVVDSLQPKLENNPTKLQLEAAHLEDSDGSRPITVEHSSQPKLEKNATQQQLQVAHSDDSDQVWPTVFEDSSQPKLDDDDDGVKARKSITKQLTVQSDAPSKLAKKIKKLQLKAAKAEDPNRAWPVKLEKSATKKQFDTAKAEDSASSPRVAGNTGRKLVKVAKKIVAQQRAVPASQFEPTSEDLDSPKSPVLNSYTQSKLEKIARKQRLQKAKTSPDRTPTEPVTFGRQALETTAEDVELLAVGLFERQYSEGTHSDESQLSPPDKHIEHDCNLSKGDRVVVVNAGRTEGKMAVVLDPQGKDGLVRVEMVDQKGKTKLFDRSELIKVEPTRKKKKREKENPTKMEEVASSAVNGYFTADGSSVTACDAGNLCEPSSAPRRQQRPLIKKFDTAPSPALPSSPPRTRVKC